MGELKSLSQQNVAECNVHYLMGQIYKQFGQIQEAIHCFTLAQDRLSNKAFTLVKDAIEKVGDCEPLKMDDLKLIY